MDSDLLLFIGVCECRLNEPGSRADQESQSAMECCRIFRLAAFGIDALEDEAEMGGIDFERFVIAAREHANATWSKRECSFMT